jgi:hypothetical protein
VVKHVDIAARPRRQNAPKPTHPHKLSFQKPQSTSRISWEPSPRLNRFERVA